MFEAMWMIFRLTSQNRRTVPSHFKRLQKTYRVMVFLLLGEGKLTNIMNYALFYCNFSYFIHQYTLS